MDFDVTRIGTVRNDVTDTAKTAALRESTSRIEIEDEFADGLHRIEDNEYITILFYLHESGDYTLTGPRRDGIERGTFASRSPNRPSPIGSTTVELIERDGHDLIVRGLDAIDGTPVLDIKPYAPSLDRPSPSAADERRARPRAHIESFVRSRDLEAILLEAGEIHGHFCPYLALGVMAGVHAQRELGAASEGMEDVLAILETNSCFADGVQVATGCTVGNNALIYRDFGKTAVTLVDREHPDSGVRMHVKEREAFIDRDYPEAADLFETVVGERNGTPEEREQLTEAWADVAFDLIHRPIPDLFDVETGVSVDVPEFAPLFDDEVCDSCGEQIMAPKAVTRNERTLCRDCADAPYFQLDGRGLRRIE